MEGGDGSAHTRDTGAIGVWLAAFKFSLMVVVRDPEWGEMEASGIASLFVTEKRYENISN